jgi:suppressor for copper-sensitivity B
MKHILKIICLFIIIFPVIVVASNVPPVKRAPVSNVRVQKLELNQAMVDLISSTKTIKKRKDTTIIGVRFKVADGGHIYWRTSGDTGYPPKFNWLGSSNLKSAKVLYPYPKKFKIDNMINFGYDGEIVFPVEIELLEKNKPLILKLKTDYVVCRVSCYPEISEDVLELSIGRGKQSRYAELIEKFHDMVPVKSSRKLRVKSLTADSEKIYVEAKANKFFWSPELFIESSDSNLVLKNPSHITEGKIAKFVLNYKYIAKDKASKDEIFKNDLTLTLIEDGAAIEVSMIPEKMKSSKKIQELGSTVSETTWLSQKTKKYLLMFFIAFIGGLIINAMPCVLPVLSFKLAELIKNVGLSKITIRMNILAVALGIIFAIMGLAVTVHILKLLGMSIGWGIHFQSDIVLGLMIAGLLLFAMNMFGFFNIPVPQFLTDFLIKIANKLGYEDSQIVKNFFSGIFVAILATPCSAPFLGTAIGFAFSKGILEIYLIFAFVGLGLASPYILLSAFPSLINYLPKPGKWMEYLKDIIGVALVLTAIWLASIIIMKPTIDAGWIDFDEVKIEKYLAANKPVFVTVTADWCMTCKVNKRFVLDRTDVKKMFEDKKVVMMRADWTKKNDKIAEFMAKYERYAIPFNVLFYATSDNPILLPELLNKKVMVDAFKFID